MKLWNVAHAFAESIATMLLLIEWFPMFEVDEIMWWQTFIQTHMMNARNQLAKSFEAARLTTNLAGNREGWDEENVSKRLGLRAVKTSPFISPQGLLGNFCSHKNGRSKIVTQELLGGTNISNKNRHQALQQLETSPKKLSQNPVTVSAFQIPITNNSTCQTAIFLSMPAIWASPVSCQNFKHSWIGSTL
jgi:hypothetical protein